MGKAQEFSDTLFGGSETVMSAEEEDTDSGPAEAESGAQAEPVAEEPQTSEAAPQPGAEPGPAGEPETGAETAPAEAAPAAETAQSIREFLASQGLQGVKDLSSDLEAAQKLVEGYKYAQYQANVYRQQAAQAAQMAQQRQQAAVPEPAPEATAAKPKWEAPEFNPAWLNLLVRDEKGNITTVPGADPKLPEKYQAWKAFNEDLQHKFVQNPYEFMWGGLEERIESKAREVAEQIVRRQQAQQHVESLWANHAGWIAERGPDGQLLIDPATSAPVLTPEGRQHMEYLQRLQAAGLQDPQLAWELSFSAVTGGLAKEALKRQQATAAQPSPAQVGEARKQDFIARSAATKKPNRSGSIPRPEHDHEPAQTEYRDIGEMLRRRFREAGFAIED